MGMFDIFKKKAKVPRAEGKKSDSNVFENPAVEQHQAARPWVDRHYMSGYDVGGIKGYTDLMEKPRCDEVGKDALFKWVRYGQIVIITNLLDKNAAIVVIPRSINGYPVVGIERLAFLSCNIQSASRSAAGRFPRAYRRSAGPHLLQDHAV